MDRQEVAAYLRISATAVDRLATQHKVLTRHHIPEMPQVPLYLRSEVEGIVMADEKAKRTPPARRPPTPRERRVPKKIEMMPPATIRVSKQHAEDAAVLHAAYRLDQLPEEQNREILDALDRQQPGT
jgi:hypothetical protein